MQEKKIAVAWDGLPFYAAGLIAAGIQRLGRAVPVIATSPQVPVEGVEERLGQSVHWVGDRDEPGWSDLGLERPDIFIHTGWAYPPFNSLAREVRAAGGRVVSLVDNSWKNSPRQWAGAIYYRMFLRRRFAAVWVPGRSGARFCRFLGVAPGAIYQGMYGADPALYRSAAPLSARPKKFLFVGQFIKRKGVDYLLEAFAAFRARHPDWELHCIGDGPYADALSGPGIRREPFRQADYVARIMSESRFLVLPGREEHWGLVVHEAALSGCGLILSDRIGALADLANDKNCFVVRPREPGALEGALESAATLPAADLDRMQSYSLKYAALYGPDVWADTFLGIIRDLS